MSLRSRRYIRFGRGTWRWWLDYRRCAWSSCAGKWQRLSGRLNRPILLACCWRRIQEGWLFLLAVGLVLTFRALQKLRKWRGLYLRVWLKRLMRVPWRSGTMQSWAYPSSSHLEGSSHASFQIQTILFFSQQLSVDPPTLALRTAPRNYHRYPFSLRCSFDLRGGGCEGCDHCRIHGHYS